MNGRMRIACRDGITDPEELERSFRIAQHALRPAGNQIVIGDFTAIGGQPFQVEIEIVERDRAVIDDFAAEFARAGADV